MKIYEHQGVQFNQTDKNEKKKVSDTSSFQAVMDQITSSSINKGNNNVTGIRTPLANDIGVVFKDEPVKNTKNELLNTLKNTLDLVDFYTGKLADMSISSDSLTPLVDQIEQRLDNLKEMGSSAGANDKLKTIISDMTNTMGVEIERFKRGDYR